MRLVSVWNGWKVVFHAATTQRSSRIWDDSASTTTTVRGRENSGNSKWIFLHLFPLIFLCLFFQGPPPRPVPPGPFSLFICPFMLIADRGHNRRIYEFLFFIYFSTSFLRSRTWELFIKRVISIVLLVKSEENLLSSSRKSSALFLRGRISSVGVILSQATSSGTTSVVVPGGVLPCPALHFPCRRPI